MSNRNKNLAYKPTRKEINAINHYWEVAMQQAKAVKNREQRRKNHPRG